MGEDTFSQLAALGSTLTLIFGLVVLWRHSLHAYVGAFQWQSLVLAGMFVLVGYYGGDPALYVVAAVFWALKVMIIPRYLNRLHRDIGAAQEDTPYVNTATSLVVGGLLVVMAYAMTRPMVLASTLPTRGGIPLAMGLILVGLFVLITRKKALTQIVGFLVLENGIALLAVLGTYGIPLIIELGVFLDVLLGFLVMQVFVYHIHGTFETIDVDQLNQLKH
ncbi:MAG: hypothetical protein HZB53_04820 [Chloroflexi bacterium]|nr:hypothetical protein [Chloroflexota bacterium]